MIFKSDQGFLLESLSLNQVFLDREEERVILKVNSLPTLNLVYLEKYAKTPKELLDLYGYMGNYILQSEYYPHLILGCFYYDFNVSQVIKSFHPYGRKYFEVFQQHITDVCDHLKYKSGLSKVITPSSMNLSTYAVSYDEVQDSFIKHGSYYLLNRLSYDLHECDIFCILELIVKNEEVEDDSSN